MRLDWETRMQRLIELHKILMLRYIEWILMHDYCQVKLPQTSFFIIPVRHYNSDVLSIILFRLELLLTLHNAMCNSQMCPKTSCPIIALTSALVFAFRKVAM
ncbi:hypothetical protein PVAP13_8NG088406 [Panicum virgatum]|uniref:Uncharacterized protein n=1 Tax=Panicum virgatum TaxID=38727 RepID=A0A8T0PAQ0_PANVG|nr:hypothetical protein PVAP13_8NG088406 [Panicum virgatum]